MRKSIFGIGLAAIIAALLGLTTLALMQEAQQPDEASDTLSEITGNPEEYYEQTVTFDGFVNQFLNSRIFVVTEAPSQTDTMVLAANTSDEEFDLTVTKGARVRVTGVVRRSLDARESEETAAAESTPGDVLQFIYDGNLVDDYDSVTVVVVDSIDDVQVLEGPEAGAETSPPAAEETGEAAAAQTIEVGLTEYSIDMPSEIPSGKVSFVVTNNGTVEHNFEIEGPGLEQDFQTNLQPGETRTMDVDLQSGTYEIYCPVDGHRGRGMEVELTATES